MTSIYTPTMVSRIQSEAPLNFEKAKLLSVEFGGTVTPKSVISKAKHLGVEYIPQTRKVASRDTGPTKAAILAEIRQALAMPEREGDLTKSELLTIWDNLSV